MTKITTHVLDISLGKPAANIKIVLEALSPQSSKKIISEGLTNTDGRITPSLYEGKVLNPGLYGISFSLANYFASSNRASLYPFVTVHFMLEHPEEHFHLPLLISPGGYSTYRGS